MTSPEIKKESSKTTVAYELDGVRLNPVFANIFRRILIKHIGLRGAEKWLRAAYPRMKILDVDMQETSKAGPATEPHDATSKALTFATEFWKRLVKAVGERQAKDIMHLVMDNKKMGRRGDLPMFILIFSSIVMWPDESDEKIAKRIVESTPCCVRYESGAVGVVNDWTTEARETVIERTPMKKSLTAIEKQVGRIRRWAIEEGFLVEEYAHKRYYRAKGAGGSGGR